jgi:threonine/homoserine/homoserine lactone efflux protein
MIPIDSLITFFIAALLLSLAPGPDNVFVLTQSALYGRVSGLLVTLGLCTGLIVHTAAVALGIAVIFQTSPIAFTALKIVGAGYLLYLAWLAWRAAPASLSEVSSTTRSYGALYRRGIYMNISNPKVSIFFLAFLPQFASPERGSVAVQMMILGAVFIFATLLIFGAIALLAGSLGAWMSRSDSAQRYLNRLAGTVFAALAIKLLTTQQ